MSAARAFACSPPATARPASPRSVTSKGGSPPRPRRRRHRRCRRWPARSSGSGDLLAGDVIAYDAEGRVAVEVEQLQLQCLDRQGARDPGLWMHELKWRPVAAPEAARPSPGAWLILGDAGGVGEALAA